MSHRYRDSPPKPNVLENSEPCQFYQKIGACRHGDKCSRVHTRPVKSNTILLKNLYRQAKCFLFPYGVEPLSDALEQAIFEEFFEEVYNEVSQTCGRIREMHVCENHGAHLNGNVYVRFYHSSAAQRAVKQLGVRYFAGALPEVELSPVHDFVDASCRQHQTGCCSRGGICNFMHVREIRNIIRDRLQKRSKSRSPSPCSSRGSSRSRQTASGSALSDFETSEGVRKRRCRRKEPEVADGNLPTKYQTVPMHSSSDEMSDTDPCVNESLSDDSRATPKAFRTERFVSADEMELPSSDDSEPADLKEKRERDIKKMQIIRHRRWELMKGKIGSSATECAAVDGYEDRQEETTRNAICGFS